MLFRSYVHAARGPAAPPHRKPGGRAVHAYPGVEGRLIARCSGQSRRGAPPRRPGRYLPVHEPEPLAHRHCPGHSGVGAVLGAVLSPGRGRAVLALARTRAQRVNYVPVSGAHLYACGVPLTEEQFREAFAAMNADLGRLPPPAERSDGEMKQQHAAVNRFSVLTGTFSHAYPIRDSADDAWAWYQENDPYAAPGPLRGPGRRSQSPRDIATGWNE